MDTRVTHEAGSAGLLGGLAPSGWRTAAMATWLPVAGGAP